jgi:Family of unknown function (DUF6152)
MKRHLLLFAVAAVFVCGITAYAHHSIAATYDGTKEVKLVGKIVEFDFRNPHAFVHIEAPDAKGVVQRWAVEWGGAGSLGGQGVTRSTLKAGDEVVITGNPARGLANGVLRVKMNTLFRQKDGFGWGTKKGEVVD